MNKFNVGDRVRVVNATFDGAEHFNGSEGTVIPNVEGGFFIRVVLDEQYMTEEVKEILHTFDDVLFIPEEIELI